MKVDMAMQDILATIQRNQQQIDLLTANNTQLTSYLLQQGLIQHLSQIPGFRNGGAPVAPAVNRHTNGATRAIAAPSPPVSAPAATGKRRGRPPKEPPATATKPASNVERGRYHREAMLAWARAHGGVLNLAEFRATNKGRMKCSPTFWVTTMYSCATKMVRENLLAHEGPGLYRLKEAA